MEDNYTPAIPGAGCESTLVPASASLPDACMSEPNSPCDQEGSKVSVEKKRDGASSPERAPDSVVGTKTQKKSIRNNVEQHDQFQGA